MSVLSAIYPFGSPIIWRHLPRPHWHELSDRLAWFDLAQLVNGAKRRGSSNNRDLVPHVVAFARCVAAQAKLCRRDEIEAKVACNLIAGYLGEEWVFNNFLAKSPKSNFFRSVESDEAETHVRFMRMVGLCDLLINLSCIDGFPNAVEKMKTSHSVEPDYAELETASLLYKSEVSFRFVKPKSRLGEDYDFEIYFCGQVFCAEAKCKLEINAPGATTIYNRLHRAKRQLPKDKPAIIFVKLPQNWLVGGDIISLYNMAKEASDRLFEDTQRVTFVIFFLSMIFDVSSGGRAPQWSFVIYNGNNRFGIPDVPILRPNIGQLPHWFNLRWVMLPVFNTAAEIFSQDAANFKTNEEVKRITSRR